MKFINEFRKRAKLGFAVMIAAAALLSAVAFWQALQLGHGLIDISRRLYPAQVQTNRILSAATTLSGGGKFLAQPSTAIEDALKRYAEINRLSRSVASYLDEPLAVQRLEEIRELAVAGMNYCNSRLLSPGTVKRRDAASRLAAEERLVDLAGQASAVVARLLDEEMTVSEARVVNFRWIATLLLLVVGGGLLVGLVDYLLSAARRDRDYERLLSVSITDEETGLYNRDYFERRFLEYINLARRKKVGTSAVLVPMKDLRELKERGAKLTNLIRDYDLCARFDKKLLVLLLHEVKAHQLKAALRRMDLRDCGEGEERCAAALFPRDGEKVDELLKAAKRKLTGK